MKTIGVLWDEEVEWNQKTAFGNDEVTNQDYEVYTELAREEGVELYIGHYTWYNQGSLEKAWYYDGESWIKKENIEIDGVYDKFKFDEETRELKKQMLEEVSVLNNFRLEELCKDKLLTYQKFSEYVPETREASEESIQELIEDFGKAVLKPRYDFGGRGIKVVESIEEASEVDYSEGYVVQGFIDSSRGIPELDIEGMHDLRAILINDEIAEIYVRQPSEGYLSNQHLGGTLTYISVDDYPEKARPVLEAVGEEFSEYSPSIYTVDLIFDGEGNPWILELNSKPGIGFAREQEQKEYEHPAMKKVVKALKDL